MRFGQRSIGAGGALGTTANISRCAVVGCNEPGKAHVCPYDGSLHGHGAIHYAQWFGKHSLTFHDGDWYWICDKHYAVCVAEHAEQSRKLARVKGE